MVTQTTMLDYMKGLSRISLLDSSAILILSQEYEMTSQQPPA